MKRKVFFITIILLLIFTVSCAQQAIKGEESSIFEIGDVKKIKVTADNVNVTTGCSKDTPVIQTANKNSTLNVISKVSDWYAVKLPDNQIGFVPERECKAIVDDKKSTTTPETQIIPAPETKPGETPDTTQETVPKTVTETTPDNEPAPQVPSPKDNTKGLTEDEQEMLRLVNEARSQNGVQPLSIDMELTSVARIKSQDMIDNKYFSHNSPKYGSPFDMMKDFGIEYVHAGENIAGNQNVKNAHDALMNSPGHRENILKAEFTHIGIGIKNGSSYGKMFTQMFISKPK